MQFLIEAARRGAIFNRKILVHFLRDRKSRPSFVRGHVRLFRSDFVRYSCPKECSMLF